MNLTASRRLRAAIPLLGVAATLVACGTSDLSPTGPGLARASRLSTNTLPPGYVAACKWAGLPGTYSFRVSVTGGGAYTLPAGTEASVQFDGQTGACVTMYVPVDNGSWT